MTNSIQMLRKDSEGDGESKTTKPENALDSKIVASECFGLSRERCTKRCCGETGVSVVTDLPWFDVPDSVVVV